MITDLSAYLSSFYHQYTELLWALLLLVAMATGIVLRNFLYIRQVADNGKVTSTPRFKFHLLFRRSKNIRCTDRPKPYTGKQRRLLARFFSLQTTIFGLTVFMLGLASLGFVLMIVIENNDQSFISPLSISCLLIGAICATLGVLLIYRRDKNNPFK